MVRPGTRFAHLPSRIVESHDARPDSGKPLVGHHEGPAVEAVEALRNVAGQLHVLRLVVTHRNKAGLVEQDVRRH